MAENDEFGDLYSNKVLSSSFSSSSSSSSSDDDHVAAAFPSGRSLGSLFRLLEDDPDDFKQGSGLSSVKIGASVAASECGTGLELKDVHADTGEDDNCNANGGLKTNDMDTDSEDDIKIVLEPRDRRTRVESNGNHSSEDSEDGEDFVILNDEKGQNGNTIGGYKGSSQIGYSGQGFQRNYQYVRSTAYGRSMPLKHGTVQDDWIGSGRGTVQSRRILRRKNTTSGYKHGVDYSLPSKKTIFDIDIESLDEKPWRHPHGDISDYFNYGFDESSWKEYCHKLAQYRLENFNSKIEVYESGSLAQEFDPDLPPELAIVASKGRSTNDGIAGKTYFQGHPLAQATQVDGGFWERCSAVHTQGLTRASDAIALIDVASSKEESLSDDHCPEDSGTATKMTHDISPRSQLDFCKNTREQLNSQIMITTESQAYFFRHIIPSQTESPRSHSTSLIHGSQPLHKNHNNDSQKSVVERRKCQASMVCSQKKSSMKINGNKGGFTSSLLRTCKNRSDKWNQSRCQDIIPVETPSQNSIELADNGLLFGSEDRGKKNKIRGVFEQGLNRDALVKRSFTCAVEKVVKLPIEVNGGKREALLKNKRGSNKMVMKESSGLIKGPDFLWEGNEKLKSEKRMTAKKSEKLELNGNPVCGNSQPSRVESNHRIVVNGNQGTKHKLVKGFIPKEKQDSRDNVLTSMRINMNQNIHDNMLSEKEQLPAIQNLETDGKLDNKGIPSISTYRGNKLIKHTSVFGTSQDDRTQLGFSSSGRIHSMKLMGSLKLLHTLKKSREKKSLLQQRASLHSGNKPQFHNFRKKIGCTNNMQPATKQRGKVHSEFKGEICRGVHEEMEDETDCLADVEGLSPINVKKCRPPELHCVPIEQRQHSHNRRRRGRGKYKLNQSDAADLGYGKKKKISSESVIEKKNENPKSELGKDRKRPCSASVDDWKNENEDHNHTLDHTNLQSDNITLQVSDVAAHDIDKTEQPQEDLHDTMSASSQDENHPRGRSKFERWTSHSEQVVEDISECMINRGNRISFSKKFQDATPKPYVDDTEFPPMGGNRSELQMIRVQKFGKKRKRSRMATVQENEGFSNAANGKEAIVPEITEKFVKRRQRFDGQMVEERVQSSILANKPLPNFTVEVKAERPRRKRQWCGS